MSDLLKIFQITQKTKKNTKKDLPTIRSIFFKLLSNFPWVLTETDAPSRVKIGFQSSPNSLSDVATSM